MAGFPEDVIEEIFTKLPVKSLVRFRSVSTHWSAFCYSKTSSILVKSPGTDCFHMIDRNYASHNLMSGVGRLNIVDSCNGLVCVALLSDPHVIYVHNPTTRESRFVPRLLDCDYGGSTVRGRHNLRFVFDAANDDYKIVRVVFWLGPDKQTSIIVAEVYSLKTDCWEILDDVNVPESMRCDENHEDKFIASASGIPSWLLNTMNDKQVIVTFDVLTHLFHETLLPDFESRQGLIKIMTLDGSLALISRRPALSSSRNSSDICDVLVLDKIGVQKSWTKRFTIPSFPHYCIPLGFWSDYGLVFKYRVCKDGLEPEDMKNDKLMMYEFEQENYQAAPIFADGDDVQVVNHVETHVSPKTGFKVVNQAETHVSPPKTGFKKKRKKKSYHKVL